MAPESQSPTEFGGDQELPESAMPELLRGVLSAFENVQDWAEDLDFHQPVTSLHTLEVRLKDRLNQSLPRDLDPKEELQKLRNLLAQSLRNGGFVRVLEEEMQVRIRADTRLLHLNGLLDECDRVCHGSPVWILGQAMDSAVWKQALAILAPLFEGERASSPEELGRRAAEAFLKVSEPYYLAYLRCLVTLMDARRSEIRTPGTFKGWKLGKFLEVVGKGFPGANLVVELDAQRIRNAIAHQDFQFDPETQTLVLQDRFGEVFRLAPTALLQRAAGMYEIGVLGLQNLRTLWTVRLFRRGRFFEAVAGSLSLESEAEARKAFLWFASELAKMNSAKSQLKAIPEESGLK